MLVTMVTGVLGLERESREGAVLRCRGRYSGGQQAGRG